MTQGLVSARLGITVRLTPAIPQAATFAGSLEVGLRQNPKRVQLLVSRLLGKHIPVPVADVLAAAHALGAQVRAACAGQTPLVIGFAETATGLGHGVASVSAADGGPAPCWHTTRRPAPAGAQVARFSEEHSHAVDQSLVLTDDAALRGGQPLVLVDDELTTGRTAVNAIRALHARWPRRLYVLASLVDCRGAEVRSQGAAAVRALGAGVVTVSLLDAEVGLPAGVITSAQAFIAAIKEPPSIVHGTQAPVSLHDVALPDGLPATGLAGWSPDQERAARAAMCRVAASLPVAADGSTLVLGDEELMYLPQLLAAALGDEVRTSTTTRTPAVALDLAGYPLRTRLAFGSTDDGKRPAYAYNVEPSRRPVPERGNAPGFDHIVFVTDAPAGRRTADVVGALAGAAGQGLHVVTLRAASGRSLTTAGAAARRPGAAGSAGGTTPQTPARWMNPMLRSSYREDEVSFLLSDLSGHALELSLREREEAIQGGRNYAEMLPIEYAPSAEYLALFDALLDQLADEVAEHVGVVTEMAVAARGGQPVLVSLARAGTPVGILMRRWARYSMGLDLPHYSVSIVRGRGIDTVALDHIVARHDPRDVLFVDGWTGKGAIATELSVALAAYAASGGPKLSADLAVVADPGHCAALFGTRQDLLVPSACLNSTVCGLVSRTVLNDLIKPGMFHGAKVYTELAGADKSARFLDAVSSRFPQVAADVAARWPAAYAADRPVTFAGSDVVSRIQREFGLPSQHLVKPGAGEATRVLLRRLPWLVLVRPDRRDMLEHLLVLAKERGVDVVDYPDMPYSCVGLVKPAAGVGA